MDLCYLRDLTKYFRDINLTRMYKIDAVILLSRLWKTGLISEETKEYDKLWPKI